MAAVIVACGSSSSRATFENANDTPDAAAAPPAPQLGDGTRAQLNDVEFTGTVYAPNGSLPISNALVYITPDEPAAIPEGTYCDECVALPEDSFTLSTADGSFTWKTQLPNGEFFFVVQKGQFRRVRKVKIDKTGAIEIKKEMTTLPGRKDVAKGDDVPRMAVLKGNSYYDKIDESLKKLGIEEIDVLGDRKLLETPAELAKYHIVFVPCGEKDSPQVTNAKVKANIRDYVAKGGKFYVTDWSYEYVRQPFPGYISWEGESSTIGAAATINEWDAPAQAADQGLGDWLGATGDASFDVQGNWTDIKAVRTVQGLDPQGNAASVTPKVWVTAKKAGTTAAKATTVSFEHQCGRVLFSTYHTEATAGGSLMAQEKALLYVLLEVGVCIGEQAKPK
jgi:hypothetical protein